MAQIYGEELRKSVEATKKRMQDAIVRRMERIARWETDDDDCFMSQRVEEQAIAECNMQLSILDGDGMMDFEGWFDADENEVRVRWVHTRYGGAYVFNGIFASSEKAMCKKANLHRKVIRVPVWTRFSAGGSGMFGVYCGSYERVRWHTNMVTGEYVGYPD